MHKRTPAERPVRGSLDSKDACLWHANSHVDCRYDNVEGSRSVFSLKGASMIVSVALAFLAASTAPAQAAPPAPAAASPAVKPKKICHVEEAVTGSLTPKRVCVTALPSNLSPSKSNGQAAAGEQPKPAQEGAGSGN